VNRAEAETAAVDGRVLDIWYLDPATGGNKIELTAWNHTVSAITDADLLANQNLLIATAFTKWTTLFVNIDARVQANLDFDNLTHRALIAANCGTVAKMCKAIQDATGLSVNIVLDTEPYNAGPAIPTADIWNYAAIFNPTAIAYDAAMRDRVRGWGLAVGNAIWSNHPSCAVILSIGAHYAQFVNSTSVPAWSDKKYGLLPDFCDGLIDAIKTRPAAYLSEFMQILYNEFTSSGFNFWRNTSTGFTNVNRFRNADWKTYYNFDTCNLHYLFAPQKALASTDSNTINLPGHLYTAAMVGGTNSQIWISSPGNYAGEGFVRNLVSVVASTSITVDGAPFSVDAGAHVCSRSPMQFFQALTEMLKACTRYAILYQNGEFGWHRATGAVKKLPGAYYRALTAAKNGTPFSG